MTEDDPFESSKEIEATKVQLKGPNVISTFEVPPRADAVKVHEAAIRKHLRDQQPGKRDPQA